MNKSKIEWTDATWNPVSGCTPVSPGCDHCYARTMIKRYAGLKGWPKSPGDVTIFPRRLEDPFRWKKPSRVFVCSMGDLFHDDVPIDFVGAVFGVMAANPQHQFLVLTKRPANMLDFFRRVQVGHCQTDAMEEIAGPRLECADCLLSYEIEYHPKGDSGPIHCKWGPSPEGPWPLPNVLLGTTVENQDTDYRIDLLLQCPAVGYYISAEPLLSNLNVRSYLSCTSCGYTKKDKEKQGDHYLCKNKTATLDLVICGGETGPGARPMHPDWALSLRDQCQEAGISFFFKQWGEYRECLQNKEWIGLGEPPTGYKFTTIDTTHGSSMFVKLGKKRAGRILDGRTWDEMPEVSK